MLDPQHNPSAARARRRLAEQAALWYLDQREGLDEAQRAAFLDWLKHSPGHVAEYLAIARLHGDLKAAAAAQTLDAGQLVALAATENAIVPLRRAAAPAAAAQPAGPRPHRQPWHRIAAAAAALACVAALSAGLALRQGRMHPMAVYTSASSPGGSLELADGSLVQLDRDSAIAVRLGAHRRDIALLRGRAMIDVGHDPARPLQVTVGASVLRDIGTVFEVRRRGAGGTVTVISGQVDLLAPAAAWRRLLGGAPRIAAALRRGEQATMDASGRLAALAPHADIGRATAWLPGEIRFRHRSVAEVARRFNAYTMHPLVIENPRVAAMRISGRFHARDADAFVAYLATLPGVRVRRGDGCIRILGRATSDAPR